MFHFKAVVETSVVRIDVLVVVVTAAVMAEAAVAAATAVAAERNDIFR